MLILEGHKKPIRCIAYSPDGRWLVSGSEDKTLRLWDLATGRTVRVYELDSPLEALAFAPDGQQLAVGRTDGSIDLILGTGAGGAAEQSPAYSPDIAYTIEFPDGGSVRTLVFSPDSEYLAVAGWDESVELFYMKTGNHHQHVSVGGSQPAALAYDPAGAYLAIGGLTGVSFFPLKSNVPSGLMTCGDVAILALAISPNGALLATGHNDGIVNLWKGPMGKGLVSLNGHTWTVYSLSFTPDGRTLLSGSADGTVRLWDVASGRERRSYQWHKRWVTCAALSPDGMTAAAGSDDATIVVWDVEDD